jgi:hypothetical protein
MTRTSLHRTNTFLVFRPKQSDFGADGRGALLRDRVCAFQSVFSDSAIRLRPLIGQCWSRLMGREQGEG